MKFRSPVSMRGRRIGRSMPVRLRVASVIWPIALLTSGCLALEYTRDGVPLVPFRGAGATAHSLTVAGTRLKVTMEAWTNRMPGPASPSGESGFPLNVLVRLDPDSSRAAPDSFQIPAVTLWSTDGDSMLAALALRRVDGGDPWVHVGRGAGAGELTADPAYPRRLGGAPDLLVAARLLIVSRGRTRVLALPDTPVTAAY